jgi:hypothetical protein
MVQRKETPMHCKAILIILFALTAAFGLSAPYLYPPVAVGNNAVQLTWRNNATDYAGIIILRRLGTAGQFAPIDTSPGTATTLMDNTVIASATPYTYALTAYSAAARADTSNSDTVTVAPVIVGDIFVAPQNLSLSAYDTVNHVVRIYFYDSSTTETGYRIFRSTNYNGFVLIKDTVSQVPSSRETILLQDATALPNTFNQYYVVTYRSQPAESLTSTMVSTYTIDLNAMIRDAFRNSRAYLVLTKAGSFSINYRGWALKAGDTIALNENGSPDSTFSIIDISEPNAPKFSGAGKSSAGMMDKTSFTRGPFVFGTFGGPLDTLYCFKYSHGTVSTMSAANLNLFPIFPRSGFINDTECIVAGASGGVAQRGYLYANNRYLFRNNALSLEYSAPFGEFYAVYDDIIFNSILFVNAQSEGAGMTFIRVVDYSIGSLTDLYGTMLDFKRLPHIVNGMLIDTSKLKDANNIFVDTVKNLVIGLSDTELSVWTYHAVMGVAEGKAVNPSPRSAIRIFSELDKATAVITLPPHSGAASVSIYDLAGKRIRFFEGIRGESIQWVPESRTGVYVVKAVVDGRLYTERFVVSR